MVFARVVSFEGVTSDRVAQLQQEMQGQPPEGMSLMELPQGPMTRHGSRWSSSSSIPRMPMREAMRS